MGRYARYRRAAGLWWGRANLRWRRRRAKLEAGHALDVAVTSGLVVAGLLVAGTKAEETTKIALVLFLGALELFFLFSRFLLRAIRDVAERSLTVIPDELPPTVLYHIRDQRTKLLARARQLAQQLVCDLEKHEMYAELISLTDSVTRVKGGTTTAAIYAISGTNIVDFAREPLAKDYLDANERAVQQQVVVQRLFLLDSDQAHSPQVGAIMQMHEDALSAGAEHGSGVKWLLKTRAGADSDLDFALFAYEVLMRQALRPGGVRGEMTVQDTQLAPALRAFERLWNHAEAAPTSAFRPRRRR